MAAVALLVAALSLGVVEPATDPLAYCEARRRANYERALRWEARAEQGQLDLDACFRQLRVYTSTPTPAVVEFRAVEVGPSFGTLIAGATAIGAIGIVVGILIGVSIK